MAVNPHNKILIIEDDPGISNFLKTTVSAAGYDAVVSADGETALQMISSHCPDCILLDLGLPDLDGGEIIRSVRSWTQTPILMISARSMEEDKASALDAGADDYLSLALPGDLIALDFKPAAFSGFFLPCPREAGELNTEPKQYCYKFAVNASEDMQVDMLFGADASFVIYQGNKELFRQCSTNPVIQDEYAIPLKLKRGTHEFYCVFSSNSGNGWGICCRFMNKQGKSVPEFIKLH